MGSLWEETSSLNGFESLHGDRKTDVLIIGGGMAGLLCAYKLHQKGIPYLLVESGNLCGGITKNTSAKISSQHGLIYQKLVSQFGWDTARMYWEANQAALAQYRDICQKIDCDFEEKDSYIYSLTDRKKIENEARVLQKLGAPAEFVQQTALPFPVAGAVKIPQQAQFHPLKWAAAIAGDLHIYQNTTVRELIGMTTITDSGKISAKKIIVATHFPFLNKHGSYFLKLYQHRSYIIALENAPDLNGMYLDETHTGLSFRNYKDLLLVGGGGHRTGKQGGCWQEIRGFAEKYFPKAKEKYAWAAQDCMTLDGVPYIGRYSSRTKDLYVATGFNKWGMTSSMAAASLLCDLIQGKPNPYTEMFSPSRTIFRTQLALNAWEATLGFLAPTTKRCPHLGCALKWNSAEHTWDCPCHGSRFAKNGSKLDNPATGDLNR